MKSFRTIVMVIVAFAAALLGCAAGVCLTLWFRLPDHTVDLLTFTESAFGIGITAIAIVFSVVTANQSEKLTRMFDEKSEKLSRLFDEKSKEYDARFNRSIEVIANFISKMPLSSKEKEQLQHAAASMTIVGFDNLTHPDITVINPNYP